MVKGTRDSIGASDHNNSELKVNYTASGHSEAYFKLSQSGEGKSNSILDSMHKGSLSIKDRQRSDLDQGI